MNNRQELISILSKKREEYYLSLPQNRGINELRLLCDTISNRVISGINSYDNGNFSTERHQVTNPKDLQEYIKSILQIKVRVEDISKVRSWKKTLMISNNNHKRDPIFYQFRNL